MEISLWHQCLRRLEAELPEQAFNTWIRPLQAVEDGCRLRLLAPNRYVVDWVNQNCAARIGELVDEIVPAPAPQVVVEIGSRRLPPATSTPVLDGISLPAQSRGTARPGSTVDGTAAQQRRPLLEPLPQFGG
ncbi:MAG TPA: DnaA N-terminal domain-containing protein, partial [Steroidobacteraceae bacterium]|nr:DnaA N-terminal domain-containing protein [Steroidobacteraceae bacterium]